MFRNSIEKSSISDANSFIALRQVVVEEHRRESRRPVPRRSRSALRRCRARRRRGWSSRSGRSARNAIMMPHTVPNRPMNGAMLAVVARNGMRFSSLLTSTHRRAHQRAVHRRQALQGRTTGGPSADWVRWPRRAAPGAVAPSVRHSRTGRVRPAGSRSSDRQTAWTSENLLLRRKTSRNCADCRAARRNVHSL